MYNDYKDLADSFFGMCLRNTSYAKNAWLPVYYNEYMAELEKLNDFNGLGCNAVVWRELNGKNLAITMT